MSLTSETIHYFAWTALNVIVAKQVNTMVLEPYMDEPFHVPQAQAYCRGEWSTWDPKITTPPGLYLLSVILSRVFMLSCKLTALRFTNVIVLAGFPPIIDRVLSTVRGDDRHSRPWYEPSAEALVISSFPLLWFYGFLYYTDVPSTLSVLIMFLAARNRRHWTAALLGLVSCLFRQTNIIWMLYAFGMSGLHALHYSDARRQIQAEQRSPAEPARSRSKTHFFDHDVLGEKAGPMDHVYSAFKLIEESHYIFPILPPYLVSCLCFAGFVLWNGGIVLGDKTNHIPAVHVPQLYYLVGTVTLFGWPVLLASNHGAHDLLKSVVQRMFGTTGRIVRTTLMTAAVAGTIHRYTIHHPFLLSDNRHYTFYLWRRVFMLHPIVPYLFAPLYVACAWTWFLRIGESNSLYTTMLLPYLCIPTLVPTPLLEPRYFIVPYLLLRIQASKRPTPNWTLVLEALWYGAINWATMTIFLYKDRMGTDGPIRFMW